MFTANVTHGHWPGWVGARSTSPVRAPRANRSAGEDRGELPTVERDDRTALHRAADATLRIVFHVQLRQSVNVSREFNLTEDELRRAHPRAMDGRSARSVRGAKVGAGAGEAHDLRGSGTASRRDRDGPRLGERDQARDRCDRSGCWPTPAVPRRRPPTPPRRPSWITASRRSCAARRAAGSTLPDCILLAGSRRFGARVSERLALAEQAVWELLHAGAIALDGDGVGAGRRRRPSGSACCSTGTRGVGRAPVRVTAPDRCLRHDLGDHPLPLGLGGKQVAVEHEQPVDVVDVGVELGDEQQRRRPERVL